MALLISDKGARPTAKATTTAPAPDNTSDDVKEATTAITNNTSNGLGRKQSEGKKGEGEIALIAIGIVAVVALMAVVVSV